MQEGDIVVKKSGYKFEGIIVSVFYTTLHEIRVVVEYADTPMLHIFNRDQLRLARPEEAKTIQERFENRRL